MQRIALISDIHSDATALDAVLADVDRFAVDAVWCLGNVLGDSPGGDHAAALRSIERHAAIVLAGPNDRDPRLVGELHDADAELAARMSRRTDMLTIDPGTHRPRPGIAAVAAHPGDIVLLSQPTRREITPGDLVRAHGDASFVAVGNAPRAAAWEHPPSAPGVALGMMVLSAAAVSPHAHQQGRPGWLLVDVAPDGAPVEVHICRVRQLDRSEPPSVRR